MRTHTLTAPCFSRQEADAAIDKAVERGVLRETGRTSEDVFYEVDRERLAAEFGGFTEEEDALLLDDLRRGDWTREEALRDNHEFASRHFSVYVLPKGAKARAGRSPRRAGVLDSDWYDAAGELL